MVKHDFILSKEITRFKELTKFCRRNERNNQIAARVIDPTKSLSVKIGDINGGVWTYEKEFYSKDINKNVVLGNIL